MFQLIILEFQGKHLQDALGVKSLRSTVKMYQYISMPPADELIYQTNNSQTKRIRIVFPLIKCLSYEKGKIYDREDFSTDLSLEVDYWPIKAQLGSIKFHILNLTQSSSTHRTTQNKRSSEHWSVNKIWCDRCDINAMTKYVIKYTVHLHGIGNRCAQCWVHVASTYQFVCAPR